MGGGGKKQSTAKAGSYSWGGGGGSGFSPEAFNKTMGSDIEAAYKAGPAATFDKSLYTGMGATTNRGMQGLLDTANRNSGAFQGGIDYTRGLLSGGGLRAASRATSARSITLLASTAALRQALNLHP